MESMAFFVKKETIYERFVELFSRKFECSVFWDDKDAILMLETHNFNYVLIISDVYDLDQIDEIVNTCTMIETKIILIIEDKSLEHIFNCEKDLNDVYVSNRLKEDSVMSNPRNIVFRCTQLFGLGIKCTRQTHE